MAAETTLGAFPAISAAYREKIAAMATPIGTHVRERLESMWDTMIDFLFLRIRFGVGFAYALCNDFRVAFLMTSILAVLTLHTSGVLEKVAA